MLNRHSVDHALWSGLNMALMAALALVNGCASRDDATEDREGPEAGVYACTLGQGLVLGSLEVFSDSGTAPTCRIGAPEPHRSSRQYCTGGPGDNRTCPDCNDLQKSLGCLLMMTR